VVYIPTEGWHRFEVEVDDQATIYLTTPADIANNVSGPAVAFVSTNANSYRSESPQQFPVYLYPGVHVITTVAQNFVEATGAGVAVELWNNSTGGDVIWRLRDGSNPPYLINPSATVCQYNDNTYGDPIENPYTKILLK
jgi:hypothetical protein